MKTVVHLFVWIMLVWAFIGGGLDWLTAHQIEYVSSGK